MLRKVAQIALVIGLLCLSGCIKYRARYRMGLGEAERDNVNVTQNINKDLASRYEDEFVAFDFVIGDKDLNFVLYNKSANTIKLIWDESLFIDGDGGSHKVFHSGVKFTDREAALPPSLIIKGGKLTDLMAPTDYAHFVSGKYGGWEQVSILPELFHQATEEQGAQLKAFVEQAKGAHLFKALFTLEIDGVKKPYLFSFNINDATISEVD